LAPAIPVFFFFPLCPLGDGSFSLRFPAALTVLARKKRLSPLFFFPTRQARRMPLFPFARHREKRHSCSRAEQGWFPPSASPTGLPFLWGAASSPIGPSKTRSRCWLLIGSDPFSSLFRHGRRFEASCQPMGGRRSPFFLPPRLACEKGHIRRRVPEFLSSGKPRALTAPFPGQGREGDHDPAGSSRRGAPQARLPLLPPLPMPRPRSTWFSPLSKGRLCSLKLKELRSPLNFDYVGPKISIKPAKMPLRSLFHPPSW